MTAQDLADQFFETLLPQAREQLIILPPIIVDYFGLSQSKYTLQILKTLKVNKYKQPFYFVEQILVFLKTSQSQITAK